MKRPFIAISPVFEEKTGFLKTDGISLCTDYSDAVWAAGGEPVVLPLCSTDVSRYDGLLLTGGGDIDPKLYGEELDPHSRLECERRENFEMKLLESAVKANIPVFGICRGMQVINVYFGGKMIQDIPSIRPSELTHMRLDDPKGFAHAVVFNDGSTHMVTSRHHQAVDTVPECFSVEAKATDGIIEMIKHKDHKYVVGVQWHPESTSDDALTKKLFSDFVEACK